MMWLSIMFLTAITMSCGASWVHRAVIDSTMIGPKFDGVGGVSGGGGGTRLLRDYPTTQRNEILDLLFKPNWGMVPHDAALPDMSLSVS